MRARLLLLLLVWGCDDGEPVGEAAAVGGDAASADGSGGSAEDGGVDVGGGGDRPDAAPDLGVDVGGPDASRDLGSPPEPDAGMADAGEPSGPVPAMEEVALAVVGDTLYLAWVESGAVWLRRATTEGEFTELGQVLALGAPAGLTALTVGNIPWLATATEAPIAIYRTDQPATPPRIVPLHGPPRLAALGDRLLVVGQTDEGRLAWVVLDADGPVPEPTVDGHNRPLPGSITSLPTGALLRFDQPGQCGLLSAQTAEMTRYFSCGWGPGQLISEGPRVMRLDRTDPTVRVYSLLDVGSPFILGQTHDGQLNFDGHRHILTVRASLPGDNGRVGQIELLGVGRTDLWRSAESWPTFPWPTTRAATLIGGRFLAFVFGFAGGPRIQPIAAEPFAFVAAPYGIDEGPECVPEQPVCDGIDQDCDGTPDDGQCCDNAEQATSRIFRPTNDVATPPLQFLVTDVERADAYHVAVRVTEDRWVGKLAHMARNAQGRLQDIFTLEAFDIRGAYEGRALVAAGGHNLLIARNAMGAWTAFWHYRQRPDRPPEPLGCTDVLDADVADHLTVAAQNIHNNSALIVCPDRIIQAYPYPEPDLQENEVLLLRDQGLPDISWARITRLRPGISVILLGFMDAGAWRVEGFTFTALTHVLAPLGPLDPGPGDAGAHPITRAAGIQHPDVQIRGGGPGGVRVAELQGDESPWLDVIGPQPITRAEYASAVGKVVLTAPAQTPEGDPATGFWVVNVGRTLEPVLWSTEPAFLWPGEREPWWTVSRGNYSDFVVFITPHANRSNYTISTRRVDCTAP